MKKLWIAVAVVTVIASALITAGVVNAQTPQPPTQPGSGRGLGRMMGGGNTQWMQTMHSLMSQSGGMGTMYEWMHQSGGVHDTVWKALADALGLTPDELTAQINSGKTLAQLAQEKGIETSELAAAMQTALKSSLDQAVKDGTLTQDQADQMLETMSNHYEWMINNMGAGMMGPGSGRMGGGRGGCHGDGAWNTNRSSN